MKVTKRNKVKLYLFIQQDGGNVIDLGLVSLFDATRKAHLMARNYLREHLTKQETKIEVRTKEAVITSIEAWRSGGKTINIIHL